MSESTFDSDFSSDDDILLTSDGTLSDSSLVSDLMTEDSHGSIIYVQAKSNRAIRNSRETKREQRLKGVELDQSFTSLNNNTRLGLYNVKSINANQPKFGKYADTINTKNAGLDTTNVDWVSAKSSPEYIFTSDDEDVSNSVEDDEIAIDNLLKDIDANGWKRFDDNIEVADFTVLPQNESFFDKYELPPNTFDGALKSCFDINFDDIVYVYGKTKKYEELLFNRFAQMLYTCINTVATKGEVGLARLTSILFDIYGISIVEFKKLTGLNLGEFVKHRYCQAYFKMHYDSECNKETLIINEGDISFIELRKEIVSLRRDNTLLQQRKMQYCDKMLIDIGESESVLQGKTLILDLVARCSGECFDLQELQEQFFKFYEYPMDANFLKRYFMRSHLSKVVKYYFADVLEIISLPSQPIKIKKLCNVDEYVQKCNEKMNYMRSDKYKADLIKLVATKKYPTPVNKKKYQLPQKKEVNIWDLPIKKIFKVEENITERPIKIKKLCNVDEYVQKCNEKMNYMRSDKYKADLIKLVATKKYPTPVSKKKYQLPQKKEVNIWDLPIKKIFKVEENITERVIIADSSNVQFSVTNHARKVPKHMFTSVERMYSHHSINFHEPKCQDNPNFRANEKIFSDKNFKLPELVRQRKASERIKSSAKRSKTVSASDSRKHEERRYSLHGGNINGIKLKALKIGETVNKMRSLDLKEPERPKTQTLYEICDDENLLVCFVCGMKIFTKTLPEHEESCLTAWESVYQQLPKHIKVQKPNKHIVPSIDGTINITRHNQLAIESSLKCQLARCTKCGKKIKFSSILNHQCIRFEPTFEIFF
uniref:Calmodulin n=1 Tax=Rhabditophanes sp. KR3021 TaxID=114890 RepID=A0AC35TXX3_9BILA